MKRYWLPGYEMQLLGELQKQQNSVQFCDTLLQTEGISVPTHSCVLAALSPYLSRKLSAIPSPPSGQKRRLQLQAVKPQTLLKLVGLLYSGELEVKGSIEQNDVLAAAHQFGMVDLVEGQKEDKTEKTKEVELQERWQSLGRCSKYCFDTEERDESRKMQDAQVQAQMAGRRDTYSPVEKRNCVSTGTQTVKAGEKPVGTSLTLCDQTKPPTPEPAPSDVQSSDLSLLLKPQNITLEKQFCSSDCITNPTPTSQVCSNLIVPVSLNDTSNSLTPAEEGAYQQSSQLVDSIQVFAKERAGLEDGQTNKDQMSEKRDNGGVMPEEEKGNSTEKRHAHANIGMKSLAKMKQMMETTQISIKVKLRRRTNGELWEVVSMQEADETLSVFTSLTQKPETPIPQPASTNSPKAPPHHNTSDSVTLNHTGELVPHDPVEESDEQIEKLLEDIMMGLNILPNLERDCKKPHHLSTTLNAAICQVPVTENEANQSQIHAAVAAADRVCYQDFSGHSSTDTAQNQPSSTSLSPVPPDAALSQQQSSLQHRSSVRSVGQPDEMLSKSQNSLYPEAATSALYSRLQEPQYPAFQVASSQEEQNILEFLPLSNRNETLSLHSFSSPCMDDLRLPQCLSPLEPHMSAAKQHPDLNISVNHGNNTEQQPSLHQRRWLTENPGLLQFPLSAIAHRENKRTSLKQDTHHTYGSMHHLEHLEFNPQHGRTCPDSGPENTVGEKRRISAHSQNAAELKFDPRRAKKSLECKQTDAKGDYVAPKNQKRKRLSETQDAVAPVLTYQNLKVSDRTKGQINLSVCSVSLSSNNVLVKEREMATSSSKMATKCGGKTNQQSTTTEKLKEKTRNLEECTELVNTDQTRIRTRGFLRKTQAMPSNTSTIRSPVPKSVICSSTIVTKQVSLSRRKRGRPQKIKVEELTPPDSVPIIEKKGHNEGKDEPKEDLENSGKTKSECKTRKRNRSAEVEVIPPKKTISTESSAAAEGKNNNDVIPAVRKPGKSKHMVSLEKLQKLIKHQHLKTGKSKESRETNETVRNAEDERKARNNAVSKCEEESTSEAEMDIDVTQPENSGQTEESHHIFSVTADENHNHILKKSTAGSHRSRRGDTSSAAGRETRDTHPLSPFDGLEEEVTKLAAEGEQPLNGQASPRSTGVSDKTQTATNDGGSSHSDWNPQTVETTGPSLSDAGRFSWRSGCNQEEEEVDILLYSPDKEPQSKECEDGLDNTYETPDEEEEEDVNEIDVTGDEAE
ncbi:hypothetical protein PAMP_020531 [Pampus punctatissimus]